MTALEKLDRMLIHIYPYSKGITFITQFKLLSGNFLFRSPNFSDTYFNQTKNVNLIIKPVSFLAIISFIKVDRFNYILMSLVIKSLSS